MLASFPLYWVLIIAGHREKNKSVSVNEDGGAGKNRGVWQLLIEHWGSGIPRIIGKVKAAGLREPEFIGGEVDLRINIYRKQANDNGAKNGVNTAINVTDGVDSGVNGVKNGVDEAAYADKALSDQVQKLLKMIAENPTETQAQYAEKLGVSKRTVSRIFMELKEQGILEQQGSRRKVKWIVLKKR